MFWVYVAALVLIIVLSALAAKKSHDRAELHIKKADEAVEAAKEQNEILKGLLHGELVRLREAVVTQGESAATWERKFWEMHDVVERVLRERDGWKTSWRQQAAEHLEGQAVLEQHIVGLRTQLRRAAVTLGRLQKKYEPERPIVKLAELDPLDAAPVGQAERYYERMKVLLKEEAPTTFDALMARDEIAKGLAANDEPPPAPMGLTG